MSRKQAVLLFTTLLQILSSESAVVNKPPVKTPEFGDCGGAFRMNYRFPTLSIGTARSGQYAPGQDCLWTIIGAPSCITQITCPQMDMRNDCENEYVYISDGVGGDLTLCGSINNFTIPLRASKGVRDLYINFVSSENTKFDRLYTGFRCDLSCVPNNNSKAVRELQPDGIQLKEDPTCMCGMLNNDASQRIVGGENANTEEFPWVAALVKAGTRQPFCGSSILNNKWVLTAAHCFFFKADINVAEFEVLTNAFVLDMKVNKGANYQAEFGQTGSVKSPGWDNKKVTDKDEKSLRFQVEEVIMHPLMNKDYDFDVALIRVKGTIPMRGKHEVLPICLPPLGYFTSFDTKRAVVSGWGLAKHDAGASTRVLQKLVVPIIPRPQCQKMLPTSFVLSARQMCAGYQKGGKDSCKGDSGGPLSLMPLADKFRTQQQTIVGIVSVGFKCALPNRPGIYTRVTEVNQWIQYRTRQTTDAVWCKSNI